VGIDLPCSITPINLAISSSKGLEEKEYAFEFPFYAEIDPDVIFLPCCSKRLIPTLYSRHPKDA